MKRLTGTVKYLPLIILMIPAASCGRQTSEQEAELQALYLQLDNEIARSRDYEEAKEKRIARLRDQLSNSAAAGGDRVAVTDSLVTEFEAYNADSALYYVNLNLERPEVRKFPGAYTRLLIKKADIYAHAGLFSDALTAIHRIPADSLTAPLLEEYYATNSALYQYLSEYTNEHESSEVYEQTRSLYADSLNQVIGPDSFNYLTFVATELARNGNTARAIEIISGRLDDYQVGMREYSILASTLAYIYKISGDYENYKHYLALSAISDVKGAVKENMSFREVATVMFEDGDIERANRYLKKSIADANFYSALLRNAQSSKLLPVIDDAYTTVQDELTGRLRRMVWISSILSMVLIVTILFIMKQFKSLRRAKDRVSLANEELSKLSGQLKEANAELKGKNAALNSLSVQLKDMNKELADRNTELSEFNRIKEQYAGLFMEYCSSAISSLQHYQLSLRNLVAQGGNRASLLKKLESTDMADQLLKNFYVKFDEAILNIYPSFVRKFNALLLPDEQIMLKNGELLNTELRLFALIRIGMDDSAKIAEFLRCSISTVYTYRSKMRKRAINPATFESDVKNIG